MLNLRKIAVTGGIASGKSSVCRFFAELGAFVVSSDAIAHEILKDSTSPLRREIVHLLKIDAKADEKLFRRIIADKVFKDPNLLASLERILHPAVLQKIEELYAEISKQKKYSYFVVEMPLLFEIHNETFYDTVITVLTEEKTARSRFASAGFSPLEYDQRMQRQIDPIEKGKRSHYVLHNDGTLEDLKQQVLNLHKKIKH